MRRLTHLVVLAAFLLSSGGNWAVFQAVAWGNMIREYSEMVPLSQAVEMTFSGKYPCALCKLIAEKKTAEQQKTLALDKLAKTFLVPSEFHLAVPRVADVAYAVENAAVCPRGETPPTPPPRSSLA
ncbi:MAG: hypothetical protein WDO13_11940 [Verrucomicrobiota bacterium]